jgi:hypothetical protein
VRKHIVLITGYEVEIKGNWPEQLTWGLIGEMFASSQGSWDTRMMALVLEIARVCRVYGLSPFAWYRRVLGDQVWRVIEAGRGVEAPVKARKRSSKVKRGA